MHRYLFRHLPPHPARTLGRPLGRAGTLAIAALAASAWIAPALAQPAAPPAPPAPPGMHHPHGPMGGHMGGPGGMHHGMHGHHGRGPFGGLIFPREDRALTTAEVQTIAQAFLLWHGERSWKVVEVKEAANNTVEFALATAEGSVVARFSMDRKTGRPRRIA